MSSSRRKLNIGSSLWEVSLSTEHKLTVKFIHKTKVMFSDTCQQASKDVIKLLSLTSSNFKLSKH